MPWVLIAPDLHSAQEAALELVLAHVEPERKVISIKTKVKMLNLQPAQEQEVLLALRHRHVGPLFDATLLPCGGGGIRVTPIKGGRGLATALAAILLTKTWVTTRGAKRPESSCAWL